MKWETIDKILEICRSDFEALLRSGQIPHAAGFSIRDKGGGHIGVQTATCRLSIDSMEAANALFHLVRSRSSGTDVSGFIAMMPREVADELLGVKFDPTAPTGDFVGVVHAEHLHDGVKTWALRAPYMNPEGEWILVTSGIATKVPPCIDSRRYGPAIGSA